MLEIQINKLILRLETTIVRTEKMADLEEVKNDGNEEVDRLAEDKVWDAFMAFDYDRMGYMQTSDLKNALEHLGEKVTEDETFLMIANADP